MMSNISLHPFLPFGFRPWLARQVDNPMAEGNINQENSISRLPIEL